MDYSSAQSCGGNERFLPASLPGEGVFTLALSSMGLSSGRGEEHNRELTMEG